MRNALLLAVAGLATITSLGCGDASQSTGIQRTRGPAVPAEGSQQVDDPNNPNQPSDPTNPAATTPPAAPKTPGTTTGQLGVTLSTATPQTDLGTTTDITVTVAPVGGFKGDAALTVTGLPQGATAVFSPASVTLNTTPVTSKMTVTVPVTAATSPAAGTPIVVHAASGAITATANASFKVNSKLTMTIPVNVAAMLAAGGTKYVDGWAGPAMGTTPAPLLAQPEGIVIAVINKDSAPREVHGNAGFQHGAGLVQPGALDPVGRTLKPGVVTSGYLHGEVNNEGTSLSFRITVNAAP